MLSEREQSRPHGRRTLPYDAYHRSSAYTKAMPMATSWGETYRVDSGGEADHRAGIAGKQIRSLWPSRAGLPHSLGSGFTYDAAGHMPATVRHLFFTYEP